MGRRIQIGLLLAMAVAAAVGIMTLIRERSPRADMASAVPRSTDERSPEPSSAELEVLLAGVERRMGSEGSTAPVAETYEVSAEPLRLTGTVRTPKGRPIEGAEVRAEDPTLGEKGGDCVTRSKVDGSFDLGGIPPRAEVLTVTAPGRWPLRLPTAEVRRRLRTPEPWEVTLEPAVDIEVEATVPDGRPIRGLEILAYGAAGNGGVPLASAETNNRGVATFERIVQRDVRFEAAAVLQEVRGRLSPLDQRYWERVPQDTLSSWRWTAKAWPVDGQRVLLAVESGAPLAALQGHKDAGRGASIKESRNDLPRGDGAVIVALPGYVSGQRYFVRILDENGAEVKTERLPRPESHVTVVARSGLAPGRYTAAVDFWTDELTWFGGRQSFEIEGTDWIDVEEPFRELTGPWVEGRVEGLLPDSGPLAVVLMGESHPVSAAAVAVDGTFSLRSDRGGAATILLVRDQAVSQLPGAFPETGAETLLRVPVELTSSRVRLDPLLPPTGGLLVVIEGEVGAPFEFSWLRLERLTGGGAERVPASPRSRGERMHRYNHLQPGLYRVSVDHRTWTQGATLVLVEDDVRELTLARGDGPASSGATAR